VWKVQTLPEIIIIVLIEVGAPVGRLIDHSTDLNVTE
jgi:hypothetical protein